MIPGIYKSIHNTNPAVKPPPAINEESQTRKNDFNYRSVIGSLNFLTNSALPEAQFVVQRCAQFSADTKLRHDQAVIFVLKYLKGMSM